MKALEPHDPRRPLALLTASFAVLGALCAIALVLQTRAPDPLGLIKPTKFFFAFALFTASFTWLLGFLEGRPRLVRASVWVAVTTASLEMLIISVQAARGRRSHFNGETPLDAALYGLMAVGVLSVLVGTLLVATLLWNRLRDPAFAWGVRLGLVICCVGMLLGNMMTRPTAAQLEHARAEGTMPVVGAHSVGVEDGGPGLPFVGWNTQGGDLRVGHFLGIHAIQILPLLGWWVSRRRSSRLTPRRRSALVFIGGATYAALVAVATWQALRGQPVLAPDRLTLGVLTAVLAAGAIAWLGVERLAMPAGMASIGRRTPVGPA